MKTSELTGAALDWAVAKCEGITILPKMRGGRFVTLNRGETVLLCYSTNWAQGGVIIERERIAVTPRDEFWDALYQDNLFEEDCSDHYQTGTTPLEAAMRCYVASKLGNEIELPQELMTYA